MEMFVKSTYLLAFACCIPTRRVSRQVLRVAIDIIVTPVSRVSYFAEWLQRVKALEMIMTLTCAVSVRVVGGTLECDVLSVWRSKQSRSARTGTGRATEEVPKLPKGRTWFRRIFCKHSGESRYPDPLAEEKILSTRGEYPIDVQYLDSTVTYLSHTCRESAWFAI